MLYLSFSSYVDSVFPTDDKSAAMKDDVATALCVCILAYTATVPTSPHGRPVGGIDGWVLVSFAERLLRYLLVEAKPYVCC